MDSQPDSSPTLRAYRVGVFRRHALRAGWLYRAYTTFYDAAWHGCCVHTVQAPSGAEAKRLAIAACQQGCNAEVPHG